MCVEENPYTDFNQAEYEECYNTLEKWYEILNKGIIEINEKRLGKSDKLERVEEFIRMPEKINNISTEFDDKL